MGYRITSDEMVNEHWLPLLTGMAQEDRLKNPMREPPLWPHFDAFLETQSQACRECDRLGFATPERQVGHQLMTAQDASQNITFTQTSGHNSVFSADHENARMITTESRNTHLRNRRKKTPTVLSAARATPFEVTQDQEQHQERGILERLHDGNHTCRQQQCADVARWRCVSNHRLEEHEGRQENQGQTSLLHWNS
jgi:hypothetical protein